MDPEKFQPPFSILLAQDGSQHALAAAELICDLQLPVGSSISVLGVISPKEASTIAVIEAAFEQNRSRFQERGLKVKTELVSGHPAECVIEYAEQYFPDLIVVGARGLRQTLGVFLGGVAQQVVECSRWPVLVVRAPYQGLRRVLLVTDGSTCSQYAVEYMSSNARLNDIGRRPRLPLPSKAGVQVMHVLPPLTTPNLFAQSLHLGPEIVVPLEEIALREAEEEKQGQAILEQALQILESGGVQASGIMKRGDAASEVIAFVKEQQIDLVVAGSRGLGRVRGWLLGSVSRQLVHHAGCSVLIVKGTPEMTG